MKLIAIVSLATLLLCGCKTASPLLTPAALTSEVSIGISVGLEIYPLATPDVAMARDTVCAISGNPNVTPDTIVADLAALGITNSNSKLIINSALLIFDGVYALVGTNNTATIQPYTTALCAGFTQGLPPTTAAIKASRKPLPAHLK